MMMEKAPFAWWHFWAHMRVSSLEGIEYRNSWNSGSRWWWWWYTVDAHHQGRFLYEAHSKVQLSVCLVRFLVVCVCSWVSLSLSLSCFFLARLVFLEKANGLSARRVLRVVEPQHGEREKKIEEADERELEGAGLKFPRCSWMYFSRPHIVTYNTNMTADYARTRKKSQTNKTNNKTNKKEKKNYIAYTMLYNIYMIHQASVLIRNTIR